MKIKFEWECIYKKVTESGRVGFVTNRSKVIGGWVVRAFTWSDIPINTNESMVFISDPTHLWEIEES